MIKDIINQQDTVQFNDQRYLRIFDEVLPNNAYFMAYDRYYSSKDSLETLYDNVDRDMNKFIDSFRD